MTTKKITLNADKRKVIADQFQSFYEDKVKDKLINEFYLFKSKKRISIQKAAVNQSLKMILNIL